MLSLHIHPTRVTRGKSDSVATARHLRRFEATDGRTRHAACANSLGLGAGPA
jgi:hypothetical protein